ncbi:hypothetical protein [Pseudoduganella sp. GCM10020061]|uniref:hypothetical protein n=1 Tax=Pseudoduganella sp. GCM10020061 TaxID=3317345 RepID=UPI00363D6242
MRTLILGVCALAALAAGCDRDRAGSTAPAASEVRQTKFPGQVTAGGGTSGDVAAAALVATDASYAGGTPGTAGGMGGNTGGAKMGGTVAESGHAPSGTNTKPPAAAQTKSGQ